MHASWAASKPLAGAYAGHLVVCADLQKTVSMSRIVNDIRRALDAGLLPDRFRPNDVRIACPGWADHTYGVFLPKHRCGNPGGYTEYFVQHNDGSYSLIV